MNLEFKYFLQSLEENKIYQGKITRVFLTKNKNQVVLEIKMSQYKFFNAFLSAKITPTHPLFLLLNECNYSNDEIFEFNYEELIDTEITFLINKKILMGKTYYNICKIHIYEEVA